MKSNHDSVNFALFKEVTAAIVLATVIMGVAIAVTEPHSSGVLAAVFHL